VLAVGAFTVVGVRAAISPPTTTVAAATSSPVDQADPQADAFAQAFTRAYLTWDASRPQLRERALHAVLATSLDPDAGVALPAGTRQHVRSTTVEASVATSAGRRVTVDAQTTAGEWHLAVAVSRDATGALAISGYPAVLGPPATDLHQDSPTRDQVEAAALQTVTRRVLTNYLARARSNLAADLTGGGVVVLPARPMRVLSVESSEWVRRPSLVAVTVRASRPDRVRLTLTYELTVVRRAGRWLVSGLQSSPHP
jgi:hypothetical protein